MSAIRTVLDAIVQSSTVEVFQHWQLAVAPMKRKEVTTEEHHYQELLGVVAFEAPKFSGLLTLSLEPALLAALPDMPNDSRRHRDWLRESANQLIGRIKNRLIHFQVTLRIGLPTAMAGRAIEHKRRPGDKLFVYVFRTLKGDVIVTLEGDIQPQVLTYTGSMNIPTEGEFIEF